MRRHNRRPQSDNLSSRSASAVRLLSSCGARRRARRRSLRSAALALAVVFPLAWAAGLCLRQIHAGISGLRCRGRRSGAFQRLQPCRPVRPICVSRLPAPSAPGERSALRRPAWSRAADLICPTSAHRARLRAPVSPAQNSGASGGSASLEISLSGSGRSCLSAPRLPFCEFSALVLPRT